MNWQDRGRTVDGFGDSIFVVDTGGDFAAPPLLILHGFPTCSHDYARMIDQLALGVWRGLGIEGPVDLLAHDYGTSVATELLARRERADVVGWPTLRSLTLCNGAVHIDLAKLSWPQVVLRYPTFGPMLARLGSKGFMGRRLRKTLANPAGFRDDDIDFLWSCYDGWGRAVLAFISGYMAGEIPGARLQWLEGVAHYPMVEAPEVWAASVLGFFTGLDSMARA